MIQNLRSASPAPGKSGAEGEEMGKSIIARLRFKEANSKRGGEPVSESIGQTGTGFDAHCHSDSRCEFWADIVGFVFGNNDKKRG
jgi:hypothetical protein